MSKPIFFNIVDVSFPKPHGEFLKRHDTLSILFLFIQNNTNVESKLLLQLVLCGFDICLFLFDRTAKINPIEVSTCWGSFGGFESTCFQLDQAARIKTTKISYFSCDRSGPCLDESFASISKFSWDTSCLSNALLEGSQPSVTSESGSCSVSGAVFYSSPC
jgi:hypothetical protein